MVKADTNNWFQRLLGNSRFWILACGAVLSVNIAGLVQFTVPEGSLQTIRIEQIYGFVSTALIFLALFASPFTKAFPDFRYKDQYLHARRAIGVLAFYYAFLHVCVAFFSQLGGFAGIDYYSSKYVWSLLLGLTALIILFLMAATSLDWAIKVLTFRRWKMLHRFVYLAGITAILHMLMIGSHFSTFNIISLLTFIAAMVLLRFELVRILHKKDPKQ